MSPARQSCRRRWVVCHDGERDDTWDTAPDLESVNPPHHCSVAQGLPRGALARAVGRACANMRPTLGKGVYVCTRGDNVTDAVSATAPWASGVITCGGVCVLATSITPAQEATTVCGRDWIEGWQRAPLATASPYGCWSGLATGNPSAAVAVRRATSAATNTSSANCRGAIASQ